MLPLKKYVHVCIYSVGPIHGRVGQKGHKFSPVATHIYLISSVLYNLDFLACEQKKIEKVTDLHVPFVNRCIG